MGVYGDGAGETRFAGAVSRWDEWRTLDGFLASNHLHPIAVFHNAQADTATSCYVADISIILTKNVIFSMTYDD